MPAPSPLAGLDIGVVGGSLGGLTAALLLRDAGAHVTVYERSELPLSGFRAGVLAHDPTLRYLTDRLGVSVDAVSAVCGRVRYLDASGLVTFERDADYRFTSWGVLYRRLLAAFGDEHYRLGHALVGLETGGSVAEARFANGRRARVDLLVCADGAASTARRRLLPEVEPILSGYVGWRGAVGERNLSDATSAALDGAITYQLLPKSHMVAYQVPALDGDEGHVSFVWYRNVERGAPLDELMTDRTGRWHPLALPSGLVQQRQVEQLRAHARADLAPPLAELVAQAADLFVQVVADVTSPAMVFGRVCLIGDAAFTARPHVAMGTAKAAENAWTLTRALIDAGGDIPRALSRWEPDAIMLGANLVARARQVGERSQVDDSWSPGDPDLRFGLHGPGT